MLAMTRTTLQHNIQSVDPVNAVKPQSIKIN